MSESNGKPRRIREHENEIEVELEDKEGNVTTWVVGEMDDDDHHAWISSMENRMKLDDKGKFQGADYKGLQPSLISKCLREKATGRKMTPQEATAKGPACKAQLFMMCQDVNGLSSRAAETEGKESGGGENSTSGSDSLTAATSQV